MAHSKCGGYNRENNVHISITEYNVRIAKPISTSKQNIEYGVKGTAGTGEEILWSEERYGVTTYGGNAAWPTPVLTRAHPCILLHCSMHADLEHYDSWK